MQVRSNRTEPACPRLEWAAGGGLDREKSTCAKGEGPAPGIGW